MGPLAFFLDLKPELSDFRSDFIAGLSKPQKSLSPKYLYDERGSQIFQEITRIEEYYPTRTERKVVADNAAEIGAAIGRDRAVLEYGSGASEKIKKLLSLMDAPRAYVAMDISRDHLLESASAVAEDIDTPVGAVCADFTQETRLPVDVLDGADRWLGYFPGSTIGNLSTEDAAAFLTRASQTLGPDAKFLVGVDLEKDAETLRLAYDDPAGVSAAFNLNLLERIKRELGARLNPEDFEHSVRIMDAPQRVEMHLRAQRDTEIAVAGKSFPFAQGETIHTEDSNKYSLERFDALLASTPWRREGTWTDANNWFATCLLSNS